MAFEDPYSHLTNFSAICGSIGDGTYDQDEVWLRLFQFLLKDRAKNWFNTLPMHSIGNWAEMQQLFLNEYYSQSKTSVARMEIRNFSQLSGELFHEAFIRYKEMIRKCPHHQIELWELVKFFVDRLTYEGQKHLKASCNVHLLNQPKEDDWDFLDFMCEDSKSEAVAESRRHGTSSRSVKPVTSESERIAELERELAGLRNGKKKEVGKVGVKFLVCDYCGELGHKADDCPEFYDDEEDDTKEVNYAYEDSKGQGMNSNTYHPGLRNHPIFRYENTSSQLNPNFQVTSQNRSQGNYRQGGYQQQGSYNQNMGITDMVTGVEILRVIRTSRKGPWEIRMSQCIQSWMNC
ncbi:uncharacterized protein LOC143619246 [Bidens hawaiensis]|uniref:uncharacterized protein LOC143619246 n=1 Tax=Bidens hawaiensis TaxID=980011 RepID=UPI00404B4EF7